MEKENFNFYANGEKQTKQALNKIIESKRIGNGSTFRCLGASNHVEHERALNDFYASSSLAGELLLEVEPDLDNIWENACGQGHLAKVFDRAGKLGKATDLVDRGYGIGGVDFLSVTDKWENGDIITNPPYSDAELFVRHSLDLVDEGRKVCMFLKLTFLEGQGRRDLFKNFPPRVVYVCSGRIVCAINGQFTVIDEKTGKEKKMSSATAYAWFVWEKGFKGEPVIRWIN